MQILMPRSLLAPLHYWRTFMLMCVAGFTTAALINDGVAVSLSTLACAFVLSGYENRRWLVMSTETQLGDVVARLAMACAITMCCATVSF